MVHSMGLLQVDVETSTGGADTLCGKCQVVASHITRQTLSDYVNTLQTNHNSLLVQYCIMHVTHASACLTLRLLMSYIYIYIYIYIWSS